MTKSTLGIIVIVADENQPVFVQHAIRELGAYLKEITGKDVPVSTSAVLGNGTVIAIGSGIATQLLSEPPITEKLGEEGFIIKSLTKDDQNYIVVSGATAKGTKFGVYNLMKMISVEDRAAFIDGPLDIASKPSFPIRGMHLNGWPFSYPYAFRRWPEENWQRYIDILSSQGLNLLFIWPFMEIIPLPLSEQDEAYLQEFRRVVDYAQNEHGMEVWMMQSANRVAISDCGVADPRERPYWKSDVQVDMNPADPEQFNKIMDSRKALYRIVNNVDGICTIDTDPGGWKNSPISDYVKILKGCRSLIDKYNVHSSRTKMIQWMWFGWGSTGYSYDPEHQRKTVQAFKNDLPEPWWLIAGMEAFLPMCNEEGVLPKTIYLRYGAIEGEPSYPGTNVTIDYTNEALGYLKDYPDIAGVMGNVQTPLIQFPRTFFLLNTVWDYSYLQHNQMDVYRELAMQLYPQNSELIADCFAALVSKDHLLIRGLEERFSSIIKQDLLGQSGVIARKLFPSTDFVATSLLVQLKLKAAQEELFAQVTHEASAAQCKKLIVDFLDAYFEWENEHGWLDYWDKTNDTGSRWALGRMGKGARFECLIAILKQKLGDSDSANVDSFFADVAGELVDKYGEDRVRKFGIEPFTNQEYRP